MNKNKWIDARFYCCKKFGTYPQIYVERTMHGKYRGVKISLISVKGDTNGIALSLTTRMARQLQKKIKQCIRGI